MYPSEQDTKAVMKGSTDGMVADARARKMEGEFKATVIDLCGAKRAGRSGDFSAAGEVLHLWAAAVQGKDATYVMEWSWVETDAEVGAKLWKPIHDSLRVK